MATDIELREIFHFCFLEQLLKISDPGLYILKGGVNLRFFFQSPRYSEDMDIDVLGGSVATLKKNGYKILDDNNFKRRLKTYGIADLKINDPSKQKHTDTTQRFKFKIVTESGDELPTKIEFSRRKKEIKLYSSACERIDKELARKYNRLAFQCQHYDGTTALVQKIEALAGRTETQARDVFDILILDLQGHASTQGLSKVSSSLKAKAVEALLTIDYKHFKSQVVEFLSKEEGKNYSSKQAWIEIQERIMELLN